MEKERVERERLLVKEGERKREWNHTILWSPLLAAQSIMYENSLLVVMGHSSMDCVTSLKAQ